MKYDAILLNSFISLLICFGMPMILFFLLIARKKQPIRPMAAGILIFVAFQFCIRIPIMTFLIPKTGIYNLMQESIWINGAVLGLTAALSEEIGRFIAFRFLINMRKKWIDGISYGLGHGGIECIVITGLNCVNNIYLILAIQSGTLEKLMATTDKGAIQQIYDVYNTTAPYLFLVSGIERIFALVIQMAFSVMVLYAVSRKKYLFFAIAFFMHFIIDMMVTVLSGYEILFAEIPVVIGAVCAAVYLIRSRKLFQDSMETADANVIEV